MQRTVLTCILAASFACSQDHTEKLNDGQTADSGEPCDPATDFFCVDTPDSGAASVDAGNPDDGKGEGKGDGGKKPGGDGKLTYRHEGQLNTSTGQGNYTLESFTNDGVDCEIAFEIVSAMANTECTQCDFAWSMELGTKTTSVSGDSCTSFPYKTADIIKYGHRAPTQLLLEKQGEWSEFGNSKVTGDLWDFDFEYSF